MHEEKTGHAVCRYCQDDSRVPNEAHMLAAGTLLEGRYYIGRPLGQGGFGITYFGWDTDAGSRFQRHREHFVREYQALAGLLDIAGISINGSKEPAIRKQDAFWRAAQVYADRYQTWRDDCC